MLKNCPLIKNPQFLSNLHETWWKWLSHEAIIFTKFHKDWTEIVDFSLLIANFLMCVDFFYSDLSPSSWITRLWIIISSNLISFFRFWALVMNTTLYTMVCLTLEKSEVWVTFASSKLTLTSPKPFSKPVSSASNEDTGCRRPAFLPMIWPWLPPKSHLGFPSERHWTEAYR